MEKTLDLKPQNQAAVSALATYEIAAGENIVFVGRRDGSIVAYTDGGTEVAVLREHQDNGAHHSSCNQQ